MQRVKPPAGRVSAMPAPTRPRTASKDVVNDSGPSSPNRRKTTVGKARTANASDAAAESGEMNIRVVVRCRGRSAMEASQRTPIVVSCDGSNSSVTLETPSGAAMAAGSSTVGLGLGVTTLPYSDRAPVSRTYGFDRVFGPEADQTNVFQSVAQDMIGQVLLGFNCTIFAYGQTGTGKTFTMQGDLSLTPMNTPVAEAGIIPRTLHRLFTLLDAQNSEYSVKCSYIELYNEELRDLLANDFQQPTALGGASQSGQPGGLKIYDDASKKGTMIQGLEETQIRNPAEALALLTKGSQRRQVAMTLLNAESSRSHSIFTITVHTKDLSNLAGGEDMTLRVGKLHLVDLAGSEGIGRSGAENKRAREAGMINQSLLTLGRVISALVEKNNHIPYRESKLTRLLQDSLGGRTLTTLVATVSPTRSNIEETLSTLEYAVRAKAIKNRPEINQKMSKSALIKDYCSEIERLKSDLMAAHSQTGIYFSSESWKEMSEEHERCKAELADASQRANAVDQKYESMRVEFEQSMSLLLAREDELRIARTHAEEIERLLEQTRVGLEQARIALDEERFVSEAYRDGEQRVNKVAEGLKATVGESVKDVAGLFAKVARKADVLANNDKLAKRYGDHVHEAADHLLQEIDHIKQVQADFGKTLQGELEAFAQRGAESLEEDKRLLDERLAAFVTDVGAFDKLQSEHDTKAEEVTQQLRATQDQLGKRLGSWSVDMQAIVSGAAEKLAEQSQANCDRVTAAVSHLAEIVNVMIDGALEHSNEEIQTVRQLEQQTSTAMAAEIARLEARNSQLERMLEVQARTTSQAQHDLVSQISTLIAAFTAGQQAELTKQVIAVKEDQTVSRGLLAKFAASHESTVGTAERRFQQYQKDLDALKTASSAQVQEASELVSQGQAAIELEARNGQKEAEEALQAMRGDVLEPHAKAIAEAVDLGASESRRFASAHRAELGAMTDRVRDTYAVAKDRLVVAKQDIKAVSSLVLAAHAAAAPTLDERSSRARSTVEAVRTAHAEFTASLRQDVPTGETPRKRAWPAVEATWESTAPRDMLIERFRRGETGQREQSEVCGETKAQNDLAGAADVALPVSPTTAEAESDPASVVGSPVVPPSSSVESIAAQENIPPMQAPVASKMCSSSALPANPPPASGPGSKSALTKSTSRLARSITATTSGTSSSVPAREALASMGSAATTGGGIKPRRI